MTANLQFRLTVEQAAKVMTVSPRLVYMARRISREATVLALEVSAGRLSVHAATKLLDARQRRTPSPSLRLERMAAELRRAGWSVTAPDEEAQPEFLYGIAGKVGMREPRR